LRSVTSGYVSQQYLNRGAGGDAASRMSLARTAA